MTRHLRAPTAPLVLIAMLFVAACGGTASPSPSASSPAATSTPTAQPTTGGEPSGEPTAGSSLPTTGRIVVDHQGYAITLADQWERVDMDSDALAEMFEQGADELPEGMAEMLQTQVGQMAAAGVSVFAFRISDDDVPFGTSLNVLALPSMGMSLDMLESLNVGQLETMLGEGAEVSSERVTLPAGEALRISYDLPVAGSTPVGTLQYLVVGETRQYVISCGSPGGLAAIADECAQMAESFEILT